ncbi:hypothetical protein [Peribacillus cavernae]|nr:hypothetical protein [Peribacillus cavernae]MDQ0217848.1 hypothetical protein [Peribacillus cavernae]
MIKVILLTLELSIFPLLLSSAVNDATEAGNSHENNNMCDVQFDQIQMY